MKHNTAKTLVAIAVLIALGVPMGWLSRNSSSDSQHELTRTGRGSVETLLAHYKEWETAYLKNGGDQNMVLPIGSFKGLATEYSRAYGQAKLNLIEGTISVEVIGLPQGESWDVWLIDNRPGPGRSVMPEPGDIMMRLGSLRHKGETAELEVNIGSQAFANFEPDLITVTRTGKDPAEDRLLAGTTTLFHRLYRSGQRGQFGRLSDDEPAPPASNGGLLARLLDSLNPIAQAQIGPIPNPTTPLEKLITAGRQSFFNDTFNGNGRTCGTCHRENRNLTIDPTFIATLPPNDPLFVAEFNPALVNLEKPVLMRKFGLILENVDGFDPPDAPQPIKFVMRGVPHTLALDQNTLTPVTPPPGVPGDGTTTPPNERTGWGGDGAPGTGTLREFIIGAIIQHYPQTLNRIPGVDFRLPNDAEMDALEAFMRSTGRQNDLVLTGPGALSLKSEVAARGQQIFNDPGLGKCFFCHLNAGASDFFFPGQNANFNTNVEQLPGQPARLVDPTIPPDGGFGRDTPPPGVFGIGNGTFNTPVLVESADTGPFFHNNSINTIEGAVAFYNSAAFNTDPGFGALIGGIQLEPTEVEAVAAFLRVINALENIRSAVDLGKRANLVTNAAQLKELLELFKSELEDAIRVLEGPGLHPEAQQKLLLALHLADATEQPGKKIMNEALSLLKGAEKDLKN